MKVLWLTNIPSPYRVAFFNELGKKCDLTVLFEKKFSSERDESWKKYSLQSFKAVFLKGKSVGVAEAFCPSVIKYLKKHYDHIVVTNFSDPTGILAILYLKLSNIPYELESDGAFPGSGKGPKEWFKRFLLKKATKYFSTSFVHDQYYEKYGAERHQIFRYPFTSITSDDIRIACQYSLNKMKYREKLQVVEKDMVITVGRFSYQKGYGKGYDLLMKVAKELPDVGFYIIGDEPTQEFVNWKEQDGLTNIHFVGFKQKTELCEYYAAADAFVLLSRGEAWGLAINEAMSFSLPVVATDLCVAANELIKDDLNGYIVKTDNIERISDIIRSLVEDKNKRELLGTDALKTIQEYTIESMVSRHLEVWNPTERNKNERNKR